MDQQQQTCIRPHRPAGRLRRGLIAAAVMAPLLAFAAWSIWEFTQLRPDTRCRFSAQIAGETRSIEIEIFQSRSDSRVQRASAVFLLHGIEGPKRYRRERYRTADMLRGQGHTVFIVHYFDAVDYEDLWLIQPDGKIDLDAIELRRKADTQRWVSAVVAAVREISQRDDIDSARLALDGYSLGGFIALAAAQELCGGNEPCPPRAVVVNWGGKFPETKLALDSPPTFFVHGECDDVVPLDWSRAAANALRETGVESELFVVPGAKHKARSAESDRRTLEFLETHL